MQLKNSKQNKYIYKDICDRQSKWHYCITTTEREILHTYALYRPTQLLKMFGPEEEHVKNKEETENIIYVSE